MSPETPERPLIDRLDLKSRAFLQIELMRLMLGDSPSPEAELAWATKYSAKVSDLIDYHEHDEIRELAMASNYVAAAELLRTLLDE